MRGEALAAQHQRIGLLAALGQQRHEPLGDDAGDALAQSDVGQQFGARAVAGEAQQLFPELLVLFVVVRQVAEALGAQRLRQQLFAQAFGFGMRQRLEVVADLGARLAGAHEASQAGLGVDTGAVMISTTSPFLSSVRSGTSSPLMRAADEWSPMSVCIA